MNDHLWRFNSMKKKILSSALGLVMVSSIAFADTTTEQILAPLNNIYTLIKAIVGVVGIIALTIAGARFMFSGDDMQAREGAKNMAAYSIIGLVLVWVAPLIVTYLTAPAV
ncbi:MAG: pilin [Candidatus Diapherotrites archaeon]